MRKTSSRLSDDMAAAAPGARSARPGAWPAAPGPAGAVLVARPPRPARIS